jgi:hypothetical protein
MENKNLSPAALNELSSIIFNSALAVHKEWALDYLNPYITIA